MPVNPEPQSLAPGDMLWARFVSESLENEQRERSRSQLEQIATNKGLAASIQSLSEQIRDLQGRVGYSADGTGTSQVWTSNVTAPLPWGPSLTFTLNEARVVSIETALRANAEGTATAATTNVITAARGAIFVNSTGVGGARGELGVSIPSLAGSTYRYDYAINSIICRSLLALQEGTHIVQGGFAFITAEILGGSGTAKFTASDPNIFVDVLQPAGA